VWGKVSELAEDLEEYPRAAKLLEKALAVRVKLYGVGERGVAELEHRSNEMNARLPFCSVGEKCGTSCIVQ